MQREDIERSVGAAKKLCKRAWQHQRTIAVVSGCPQICESISTSAMDKTKVLSVLNSYTSAKAGL